jgi:hypothetical protein
MDSLPADAPPPIITDVREISGGRVRLRAGTLYSALGRLRADDVIDIDREEIVENRLRRYYRLTPKGSRLLAAEAARLRANAATALARLDLAGGRHERAGGAAGAPVPAAAGLVPGRVPLPASPGSRPGRRCRRSRIRCSWSPLACTSWRRPR